ncbi:hypothetical protein [Cellvibrio fibrivorans]|uniref:Uncharacterized protein n=1 Tax=Cellvibrio fibrivorans TaxID=126350 RepID=A0ABU1V3I5_9GAMM|nr:hypothetical protein [Cellvibrio fibrivorans]MDR7091913.1 hypothetical protein [Cellvibrio fibrivorans]
MTEKRALKILFDKYWSPAKGWQRNSVPEEDFEFAKTMGVMFDDISLNHDEIIQRAIAQCNSIAKTQVVDAFLSSLSTRRLDLRSALGSFACGYKLPLHKFITQEGSVTCSICSEVSAANLIDLNVLNFERHKFGGVRHLQPSYIYLDLSLFSKVILPKSTDFDVKIIENILDSLAGLTEGKLSDAEKAIKNSIKGNKNERAQIITTMGYCGILNVPDYESLYKSYTPCSEREYSAYSKSDWPFPADLWLPKYGLNQDAIQFWFGEYLS